MWFMFFLASRKSFNLGRCRRWRVIYKWSVSEHISLHFYRQKWDRTRNVEKLGDVPRTYHRQLHEIFTHDFYFTTISRAAFPLLARFLDFSVFSSYLTLWRCLHSYLSDFIAQESQFSFNTGAVKMWKVFRARDDEKIRRKTNRKKKLKAKNHEIIGREFFPSSFVLMNFKTRNCEH